MISEKDLIPGNIIVYIPLKKNEQLLIFQLDPPEVCDDGLLFCIHGLRLDDQHQTTWTIRKSKFDTYDCIPGHEEET